MKIRRNKRDSQLSEDQKNDTAVVIHTYFTRFSPIISILFVQIIVISFISLLLSGELEGHPVTSPFSTDMTIAGIPVGGLSESEAEDKLIALTNQMKAITLQVTFDGKSYPLDKKSIHIVYDIAGTLRNAKQVAKNAGGISGYFARRKGITISQDVPLEVIYNRDNLRTQLAIIGQNVNRPAVPAMGKVQGSRIVILSEKSGYRVDVDKSVEMVDQELKMFQKKFKVPLMVVRDSPPVTKEMLADVRFLLAEQTAQVPASVNSADLQELGHLINGNILLPGDTFSFNKVVSSYVNSPLLPMVMSPEGNMNSRMAASTEIASLLYITAVKSGTTILERYQAVHPVGYVPPGFEALTDGKNFDLRFSNQGEKPIYIDAEIQGNQVRMAFFGDKIAGGPIKIVAGAQQKIPPGTIVRDDPTLGVGQKKSIQLGEEGVRVKCFTVRTDSDGKVNKELLSDDYYKPIPYVVLQGPQAGTNGQAAPGSALPAPIPNTTSGSAAVPPNHTGKHTPSAGGTRGAPSQPVAKPGTAGFAEIWKNLIQTRR